jgi:hypothetical protein
MNMIVMTATIFMIVMLALLDGFLDFLQKIEHRTPPFTKVIRAQRQKDSKR